MPTVRDLEAAVEAAVKNERLLLAEWLRYLSNPPPKELPVPMSVAAAAYVEGLHARFAALADEVLQGTHVSPDVRARVERANKVRALRAELAALESADAPPTIDPAAI